VCASLQGEAHEVQGTHETPQEIGGVGHPAIGDGIEPKCAWVEEEITLKRFLRPLVSG
jgi:hypothetical protein